MRIMPGLPKVLSVLPIALVVLAAAGCARGDGRPEARLGGGPERWRDGGSARHDGRYGGGHGQNGRYAHAPGSAADFKAATGDDIVYFSSDSVDLTPEARRTLDAQAAWLARYQDRTVTIEGHADERGTREYNIGLGAKRAAAVKAYLAQAGVAQSRVRTVSFGKERPVATCNDISCWSQNRRAQTILGSGAMAGRSP